MCMTIRQRYRQRDGQTTCGLAMALVGAYARGPAFSWFNINTHRMLGRYALRAAYFDIIGAPYHCCYAAAADYL